MKLLFNFIVSSNLSVSVLIPNIHWVKGPALVLSSSKVNTAIHILTKIASLDQVIDALAGMGVLVGILGGLGELLLQELHPYLHVSMLINYVGLL